MNDTPSIRLFRYLPADSAIRTIESHAFRVSRIAELNDPFEWIPGIDPVVPQAAELAKWLMEQFVNQMNEVYGIIAFSEEITEPVLWSHYADAHRGIVFEVDHILNDYLHKVTYSDDRPVIDPRRGLDESTQLALKGFWYHKSSGWAYEKERRVVTALKDCRTTNGMFLQAIHDDFLMRVVLGVRCAVGASYVRRALDLSGFGTVQLVQATQDNRTFKILC